MSVGPGRLRVILTMPLNEAQRDCYAHRLPSGLLGLLWSSLVEPSRVQDEIRSVSFIHLFLSSLLPETYFNLTLLEIFLLAIKKIISLKKNPKILAYRRLLESTCQFLMTMSHLGIDAIPS